jgi:hypothetical protein
VEVFTRIACDELRIEPVRTHAIGFHAPIFIPKVFPSMVEMESPFLVASQPEVPGLVHASPHHVQSPTSPSLAASCRVDPAVQQGAARLQTGKDSCLVM